MLTTDKIAENINTLGNFCGMRDVDALTPASLIGSYGIKQADVMVLFGGSIICGGDVLAQAMRNGAAARYVIAGGAGHTTETLRRQVHALYPDIITEGLPEAEVFNRYLRAVYGLEADYLETASTNCGNNITYLLRLLEDKGISFKSIILCQDATMQRRMDAGLRKYCADNTLIINYAAYRAGVAACDGRMAYTCGIPGMWEMERYIELLMGEIPRLADNIDGYGPLGRGYIAHVDIPAAVVRAFDELKATPGFSVRTANPLYA